MDIRHDGARITAVSGRELRTPWNVCRHAGSALSALEGATLCDNVSDFTRGNDSLSQCTHMFELVALASANIVRGVRQLEYDVEAAYSVGALTPALVRVDGAPRFDWVVSRGVGAAASLAPEYAQLPDSIVSPAPFSNRPLSTLMRWARATFDPDDYEAIHVLRRAVMLSSGRSIDLDTSTYAHAAPAFDHRKGDCYTFNAERIGSAARIPGSTIDFTDTPERLLSDLTAPR